MNFRPYGHSPFAKQLGGDGDRPPRAGRTRRITVSFGHLYPRNARLYDRREQNVARNAAERISIRCRPKPHRQYRAVMVFTQYAEGNEAVIAGFEGFLHAAAIYRCYSLRDVVGMSCSQLGVEVI